MPVLNRIASYAEEMKGWRRHLHMHPELAFDCHGTAAFIVERLRDIGVDEIHEGIARTGIVALIKGQGAGPVIGLRADMDALPIDEATGVAYASTVQGRMHACGHDGHVTMLLGAAKYLAETRNFAGTVALIFQPAEEDGGGGQVMVQEGIMDRFGIGQVYGIHNAPNVPFGQFNTTPGPLMASVDTAFVYITGKGGHGATPHECVDPVVAVVGMVGAIQTIIPRNVYALEEAVISVTQIHTGTASNIIPEEAMFCATIRCFKPDVRDLLKKRIHDIVEGHALAYGVTAAIRQRSTTRTRPKLPPKPRARWWGRRRWMRGPTARWGPRISPTCSRRGRGRTCSWAPARGRGCIIRLSTSTTRRLRSAQASLPAW